MDKKRDILWDVMKGIGIILVVAGHAIQYGSGREYLYANCYFENGIFAFIYSFHMPMLMLCSGYLFWGTLQSHCLKDVVISRFKTFILPIATSSALITIIQIILQGYAGFTIRTVCGAFKGTFLYNLWFLWALFYISLIVLGVNKFQNDRILLYVFIMILSLFLPDTYNIGCYKYVFPFFVLGYFLNKLNGLNYFRKKEMTWLIGNGCLFLILLMVYNKDCYIYTTGHSILCDNPIRQLTIDCYRTIIGAVGSLFCLLLVDIGVRRFSTNFICKGIAFIGRKSIGVYILSAYIFTFILPEITKSVQGINYLLVLLETIVIVLICLVVTVLIQKSYWLSLLFFGGRRG